MTKQLMVLSRSGVDRGITDLVLEVWGKPWRLGGAERRREGARPTCQWRSGVECASARQGCSDRQ